MGLPTATVRMRGPDGISRTATGLGSGPVDAACKAVDTLVRVQARFAAAPLILLSQWGHAMAPSYWLHRNEPLLLSACLRVARMQTSRSLWKALPTGLPYCRIYCCATTRCLCLHENSALFSSRFLIVLQAALEHYSVNAVTTGPEALATTRVTLKPRGRIADQGYITSAQVPASESPQQMSRSSTSPPTPKSAQNAPIQHQETSTLGPACSSSNGRSLFGPGREQPKP